MKGRGSTCADNIRTEIQPRTDIISGDLWPRRVINMEMLEIRGHGSATASRDYAPRIDASNKDSRGSDLRGWRSKGDRWTFRAPCFRERIPDKNLHGQAGGGEIEAPCVQMEGNEPVDSGEGNKSGNRMNGSMGFPIR